MERAFASTACPEKFRPRFVPRPRPTIVPPRAHLRFVHTGRKLRFVRSGLRYRGGYGRCPGIFPWRADGDSDWSDGGTLFLARHTGPSPSRRGCGGQSDKSECPSGSKQEPDRLSAFLRGSGAKIGKIGVFLSSPPLCTKRRCALPPTEARFALEAEGAGGYLSRLSPAGRPCAARRAIPLSKERDPT